jgi:hypothetical protein
MEDAVFVAVERSWPAVGRQIQPHGRPISKKALMRDKQQASQLSRGIIDHDPQGAARAALFEPGIVRAIRLHQFPEARPPLAHRMHLGFPGLLGLP